jgi:hypothetical protein
MKTLVLLLLAVAVTAAKGHAQEILSARCESALTGYAYPEWRLAETKKGLSVEYSDAKKKKHSMVLAGADADRLRGQVASLRFTQADADMLRALSVSLPAKKKEEEQIVLRPFDGVTYHFVFSSPTGSQKVWIDNPAFDLEHHYHVAQCVRLKEVLTFLDVIERRAKGQKEANQALEPTAPSGRGSS